MIVASPRPVAAASEFAPLLGLRADELQLQMAQMRMGMGAGLGIPVEAQSEEYQNGVRSGSGDRPPKYTRHSTSYAFTHAAQPSTSSSLSSSSSTSTARPSFDSFDAPSKHEPSPPQQQKEQMMSGGAALQAPPSEDLDSAPPYDSSFADTNLSTLPHEALSALSLSRENLADLERANFDELDDLDRSDNRADPDAIVKGRLAHNALIARQSAITLASSLYSDATYQQRDSVYTTYEYDPVRASVQTYGSSVLTYGSRASQLLDSEDLGGSGGDGSRPVAPLPWLPRPSALDRIQHSASHTIGNGGRARSGSTGSSSSTGPRPLPPLPTPTSIIAPLGPFTVLNAGRDRSVSLPSRSASSGSNYSASSASSAGRRPRPLPRTPTSAISPNLPDILEGEAIESIAPSLGPMRTNSMFLSPTSAVAPPSLLGPGMKGRRSASARYSTIGYGHVSRAGVRAAFLRSGDDEENGQASEESRKCADDSIPEGQKQGQMYGRASSRASMRSARSTYLVPDVDELVRILDSMDDGSGSSAESVPATPLAEPWEPRFTSGKDGEEKIDLGAVLARSRSVVNVPGGEKRSASAALEDLGIAKSIGLPTPAATPRSSPQRQPTALPPRSDIQTKRNATPQLQERPTEEEAHSPAPTSAGALSLTSFPLPPMAPMYIPAPSALGAADMPIPSAASGIPPSPSLADIGKSFAERATLPGMTAEDMMQTSQPRHTSTRDAIADLKNRVSELPALSFPAKVGSGKKFRVDVPLLGLPVPPRRRTQSSTTAGANPSTTTTKKHSHPPAIDVRAANALPPPSSFNIGRTAGPNSAPANGPVFDQDQPTIIYSTPVPSVAPLRIRRGSGQTQSSVQADAAKVQVPPPSKVPQSASAAQTTFASASQPPPSGRVLRATSFCVSPGSSAPVVAPLRFTNKLGSRARSSAIGSVHSVLPKEQNHVKTNAAPAPMTRKSSETDVSEESESDQLTTPTNCMAASTPIANVVESSAEEGCDTGFSMLSVGSSFSAIQRANGGASIDPAFADIIKSIASASEEEQMGSLLTIASSINTEHHTSGYNAGFFVPFGDADQDDDDDDGFVDIDEDENESGVWRKEAVRRSMTLGISTSERRRSKGRSLIAMKRRQPTRSAAAVRAAIRALPDPSTFPIPESAGSVATDSSALAGGADYASFMRPSPLPKLKVVTKFKGGVVLLPAASAPLSAASGKSSMSASTGHSRNASGVSTAAKRVSTVAGPRKMNRLTLTDPRSPMADAAVAAAALVARVREKRAALASRGLATSSGGCGNAQAQGLGTQRGHARTGSGSSGTLRSKLKMSGGGFFGGSNVRTLPNPSPSADAVLRNGPRARRPSIRRARAARRSVVPSRNANLDLCTSH